ncbi:alpha/beta fold hydrolase [Nocardia lasii]|uniref:Alpha/beta fold hydrolase n=1 Tax=Nocardia lasii TaxID=1616107 RepID=A0ABW1JMV3_9NOCA
MLRIEDQVVRHIDTSSGPVATVSVGRGPALVVGGWWCSHLALDWADPLLRGFVSTLAEHFTVIRYDQPGRGVSGTSGHFPTELDQEVDVLLAVVDALGIDRFAGFGASSGAAVAVGVAVREPQRVRRLVLYGSFARGADVAPPSARQAMIDAVAAHWGLGSRLLADIFIPGASSAERDEFAQFQRRSATADQAARALAATYSIDATPLLATLNTPTTVLHRRGDRAVPFALGVDVARRIPHADFIELPGDDHFPWRGGTDVAHATLRALGQFVAPTPPIPGLEAITAREREILALVAEGLTDQEIAVRLVVSPHTVHRHIANARAKLGVRTRAAAAVTVRATAPARGQEGPS